MSVDAVPGKVVLYYIPGCSTSDKALRELTADGTELVLRDASQDEATWYELEELSGVTPTLIWPDGRVEIGWKGEYG